MSNSSLVAYVSHLKESAKLALEQFCFHGMRISVGVKCTDVSDEQISLRVITDNLFQYSIGKTIKQCIKTVISKILIINLSVTESDMA